MSTLTAWIPAHTMSGIRKSKFMSRLGKKLNVTIDKSCSGSIGLWIVFSCQVLLSRSLTVLLRIEKERAVVIARRYDVAIL